MKKQKLNNDGAVLFTVICLMSILTVVLMTAIIVVSSSHKKAITNYTDSQSYVTAKSTVDTFMKCLLDESTKDYDDLKQEIDDMSPGDDLKIPVTLPSNVSGSLPIDASGNPYIMVHRDSDTDFEITADILQNDSKCTITKEFILNPKVTVYSGLGNVKATNLTYLTARAWDNHIFSPFESTAVKATPSAGLGTPGTDDSNTWTECFNTYSDDFFTNFPDAHFLWEDIGGPHSGDPRNPYWGDLIRFDTKFNFEGLVLNASDITFRCAADDAWIGYLNGNYIGYGNVLPIEDGSKVPPALPDDFQIATLVGDLDSTIGNDYSLWGGSGHVINIDPSYLVQGENIFTIYAINHTNKNHLNPACILFGIEINNIQPLPDPLAGPDASIFPGEFFDGKYINE